MALKVYTYANCSTCRNAVKWLNAHKIAFDEKPIRETPPSMPELRTMLAALRRCPRGFGGLGGGELKRLFNTSGLDYRALNLSEKLPRMSETEALQLLASNGNLVKRPFLLGPSVALNGFNEAEWSSVLL